MVEDLIKRLRGVGPVLPLAHEAADALEQQAARLTALESERDALLNSLAAARQDASTAWERHAMATRIGNAAAGELATARGRITEFKAERDALLAAAGKEAVAEPVTHETIFSEVTKWVDAHHISFEAQNDLFKALSGVLASAAPSPWEALFDRVALELNCLPSSFADGNEHVFQAIEKLRTAPTAALENGDGMSLRAQHEDACIAANNNAQDAERYRWLRDKFAFRTSELEPPHWSMDSFSGLGETFDDAIDAALSQKAGEQQ